MLALEFIVWSIQVEYEVHIIIEGQGCYGAKGRNFLNKKLRKVMVRGTRLETVAMTFQRFTDTCCRVTSYMVTWLSTST